MNRILGVLLLFIVLVSSVNADESKNVLILHGLQFLGYWENDFNNAYIQETGKIEGCNIRCSLEFLDLKNLSMEEYPEIDISIVGNDIANIEPDLIVAVLPSACLFLSRFENDLQTGSIPKLFVLPDDSVRQKADEDPLSTVIVSRAAMTIQQNFILINELLPELSSLYIVSGLSATDLHFRSLAEKVIPDPYVQDIDIIFWDGLTLEEMEKKVGNLPKNSAVLFLSYEQDINNSLYRSYDAVQRLSQWANVPIFSFYDSLLGRGIIGGSMTKASDYARLAAEASSEILNAGEYESSEPDQIDSFYYFDWRELKRWKIPESDLPENSVILYREESFFYLYRKYILFVASFLIVQMVIIVFLIILLKRKKQAETRLHVKEIESELVIENMSVAYALLKRTLRGNKDYEFTFVSVNSKFEESFHHTKKETEGTPLRTVFPELSTKWELEMNKLASVKESVLFTEYFPDPGSFQDVRVFSPQKDFYVALISDITEREMNSRQRYLREKVLKALLTTRGLQGYAKSLDILLAYFSCRSGYIGFMDNNGNLSCSSFTYRFPGNDQSSVQTVILRREEWKGLWGESLKTGRALCGQTEYLLPGTGTAQGCILAVPLHKDKELFGQIVLADKDGYFLPIEFESMKELAAYLTPLFLARENETQYIKGLNIAKQKAEENLRLKSQFLNNISHELRTPLNGIMGMSSLLGYSALDEKSKNIKKMLDYSSTRLLHIVENLLTMTEIEKDSIALNREPINIGEFMGLICSFHRKAAEKKGLAFRCDCKFDGDFFIGDKIRLTQMLNNLIENAINFTQSGEVSVATSGVDDLKIVVTDTGIGIRDEDIPKIMNSFTQLENSYTKFHGGLGIGLSIANDIVNIMNGSLKIRTKENEGSSFVVSLPNHQDFTFVPDVQEEIRAPDVSNFHVLIVEDDSTNMFYICKLLRNHASHIYKAVDGQEAVQFVRENGDKIDLILMDIGLPVIDGKKATKIIRNECGFEKPIVAVTAHVFQDEIDEFFHLGITDVLCKPFNRIEIFDVIKKVLA